MAESRGSKDESPSRLSNVSNGTTYEDPWNSRFTDDFTEYHFVHAGGFQRGTAAVRALTELQSTSCPSPQDNANNGERKRSIQSAKSSPDSTGSGKPRPKIRLFERARNSIRKVISKPVSSSSNSIDSKFEKLPESDLEKPIAQPSELATLEKGVSSTELQSRRSLKPSSRNLQPDDKAKKYRAMGMKHQQTYISKTVQRLHKDRQRQFQLFTTSRSTKHLASEVNQKNVGAKSLTISAPIPHSNVPSNEQAIVTLRNPAPKNVYSPCCQNPGTTKLEKQTRLINPHANDITMMTAASETPSSVSMRSAAVSPSLLSYHFAVSRSRPRLVLQTSEKREPPSTNADQEPTSSTSTTVNVEKQLARGMKLVRVKTETVNLTETVEAPTPATCSTTSLQGSLNYGSGGSVNDLPAIQSTNSRQFRTPDESELTQLWSLSSLEKEKQTRVNEVYPTYVQLQASLRFIQEKKNALMSAQNNAVRSPTFEQMSQLWNLSTEEIELGNRFEAARIDYYAAESELNYVRRRKSVLLSGEGQLMLPAP